LVFIEGFATSFFFRCCSFNLLQGDISAIFPFSFSPSTHFSQPLVGPLAGPVSTTCGNPSLLSLRWLCSSFVTSSCGVVQLPPCGVGAGVISFYRPPPSSHFILKKSPPLSLSPQVLAIAPLETSMPPYPLLEPINPIPAPVYFFPPPNVYLSSPQVMSPLLYFVWLSCARCHRKSESNICLFPPPSLLHYFPPPVTAHPLLPLLEHIIPHISNG